MYRNCRFGTLDKLQSTRFVKPMRGKVHFAMTMRILQALEVVKRQVITCYCCRYLRCSWFNIPSMRRNDHNSRASILDPDFVVCPFDFCAGDLLEGFSSCAWCFCHCDSCGDDLMWSESHLWQSMDASKYVSIHPVCHVEWMRNCDSCESVCRLMCDMNRIPRFGGRRWSSSYRPHFYQIWLPEAM